ncbi:MAG TPA: hypothetical protein PKZ53_12440 [Acidobacteriota bacterium]|nr:hypothetical protein [Acidobacteriota bacterium]
MSHSSSSRSVQWKAWLVLGCVFGLGCLTGLSLGGVFTSRAAKPAAVPAPNIRDGEAYFATLQRELNLNPDQAGTIKTIISEAGTEYKAVCTEVRPRYDQVRDRARSRVRVLLSADQQKKFDVLVTQENCNCPELKK